MRVLIYLNFLGIGLSSFVPNSHASLPTNGVLQTSRSLNAVLNTNDAESLYSQCLSQDANGFFSNRCNTFIDILRKKMNGMAVEADVQMQSEKISEGPLSKLSMSRISILSRINLLSTQAEEALKAYQTKDDLPVIVSTIQKVQVSVAAYTKLFPNATN